MAIHCIRPDIPGELRDPFDCDEQVFKALVTVGAFVALADGHIDRIERDEAINYIDRRGLAPTISRQRVAEFFDARARHLEDRDFADLIADALRPVTVLSLTFDVIRIAKLVAAADRHIDPNEERMVRLIRLIAMTSPVPKVVDSSPRSLGETSRQEWENETIVHGLWYYD
jgi:tellurite resistance protein